MMALIPNKHQFGAWDLLEHLLKWFADAFDHSRRANNGRTLARSWRCRVG